MVHKIKKYSSEGQYVASCSTNFKSSLFFLTNYFSLPSLIFSHMYFVNVNGIWKRLIEFAKIRCLDEKLQQQISRKSATKNEDKSTLSVQGINC